MFTPVEKNKMKHRTQENDPNVELLFRSNDYKAKNGRPEIKELNTLVALIGSKYQLNDVWGRAYKSNSQEVSILFSKSDVNGMDDKHPIVSLFEGFNIQQQFEQGQYQHLKYSIFSFNSNQTKDLLKAVELLNPSADELQELSEHAQKGQVLC